jgi:hypothetical protein
MARDEAYRAAEKKIEQALQSGATNKPLPTSPKGEESRSIGLQMLCPTSHPKRNSPSPQGGKLEGGYSHGA